jgi:hypothetical protein
MRLVVFLAALCLLAGCGVESAGTAATIGKLQAEQARQGKEQMDAVKASLDAAAQVVEERNKKAAEANEP